MTAEDDRKFIEIDVTLTIRIPKDGSIWEKYSRFGSADSGHTDAVTETFRRILPYGWKELVRVRTAQTETAREIYGSIHPF